MDPFTSWMIMLIAGSIAIAVTVAIGDVPDAPLEWDELQLQIEEARRDFR